MRQQFSVLDYADYRSYLKDQLSHFKKGNRRFSFGVWSKRLGLKSSSGLIMVMNGQRNPGPEMLESLVRDLRLTGREATFFRELVALEKSKTRPQKESHLLRRLAELHPRRVFRTIDSRLFQVISHWSHYAIRELADLPGFREDLEWIRKRIRFPLSRSEVATALKNLEGVGLLRRDGNGRLAYVSRVQSTFDVPDEGIVRYHEQMHEFSRRSLRETPVGEREVGGITFTLRQQDLPRAKQLIRQVLFDLSQLGQAPGDEVYHAELSLFPITKKGSEK